MKTSDLFKHIRDNLPKGCSRAQSSMCYGGPELGSETIIEQFHIDADDGSRFLVSITKLQSKER